MIHMHYFWQNLLRFVLSSSRLTKEAGFLFYPPSFLERLSRKQPECDLGHKNVGPRGEDGASLPRFVGS